MPKDIENIKNKLKPNKIKLLKFKNNKQSQINKIK